MRKTTCKINGKIIIKSMKPKWYQIKARRNQMKKARAKARAASILASKKKKYAQDVWKTKRDWKIKVRFKSHKVSSTRPLSLINIAVMVSDLSYDPWLNSSAWDLKSSRRLSSTPGSQLRSRKWWHKHSSFSQKIPSPNAKTLPCHFAFS